ncbi:MAG: FHA domain-containing protein [Phycisphaerae bacterium]|jgi:pSer/pThr/pTyr-binding forkhead associated (FHA) protein
MDINLLLLKKDGSFKKVPVSSDITVLGRRKVCDLRIPIDSVSRKHCRLVKEKDAIKIRDLNSRNGTIVNGRTVEETPVKPGDKLTLGPLTFVVQVNGKPENVGPLKPEPPKADLDADDTSLTGDSLFAAVQDSQPPEK